MQPCANTNEFSTRYLDQEHACKASRSTHYAVALQTHSWFRYQALTSPLFTQVCTKGNKKEIRLAEQDMEGLSLIHI